jgi:hypothetical protein
VSDYDDEFELWDWTLEHTLGWTKAVVQTNMAEAYRVELCNQ